MLPVIGAIVRKPKLLSPLAPIAPPMKIRPTIGLSTTMAPELFSPRTEITAVEVTAMSPVKVPAPVILIP